MNDDKLKELEEWGNENKHILRAAKVTLNLITAYRQLERSHRGLARAAKDETTYLSERLKETNKANAELLAALEPFATANKVKNPPDAIPYREYENAEQVYNKHKGE